MTPTEVQLALPKFAPGVIVKVRHHPSDFRIIQILLIHTRPLDKSKSRYNFEFVFRSVNISNRNKQRNYG